MTKCACLLAVLAAAGACKKKSGKPAEPTKGSADVAAQPTDAAAAAADAAPAAWDGKTPLPITEGFSTPESVLYDAEADVYLVSNINGDATGTDDNGFIAKVSPDGKITEARWIDGSKDTVKLDAPKGMTIAGGVLYVSDITVVRQFDAKTGEPKGENQGARRDVLERRRRRAGWRGVRHGQRARSEVPVERDRRGLSHRQRRQGQGANQGQDARRPNGIAAGSDGSVWVVTFGSGEIYQVNAKGKKVSPQKLPQGTLAGVVALDGGELLVSSWAGSLVYRGKPGGEWKPVVENVKSPADIGWDSKRKRVLIPIFQGNSVILHPLE